MQSETSKLIIKNRQGRNQYYDEVLAEGVLPLRMMLIPAGSFIMGSSESELERRDSEGPQHTVKLSQFFMAQYTVTQAQWRVVANLPQINQKLNAEPSDFRGDMRPVEQVSWYDAVEFCNRLTNYTNRQYRLPTEAEWEYACRAGTITPFHFGKTISTNYANYKGIDSEVDGKFSAGNYNNGPKGNFLKSTTPVDLFSFPNSFGLYDMHGNVWEWCQDHWHDSYYKEEVPTDGSAWLSKDENAMRVRRGGSWSTSPRNCRSAYRGKSPPYKGAYCFGLRVCCSGPRSQMLAGDAASSKSTVLSASFSLGGSLSTSDKNSADES
jgi:formylglycine-generating enzyme required for sulfatase activity